MSNRRGIDAFVVLILALALGCAEMSNTIRIVPATTPDSLVLLLTSISDTSQPATSVYGLSIVRCNSEATLWTIAADGSRRMPLRIVYGQPVTGFPAVTGPLPLTPGCYEALLSGAARRRFEVHPDRTIAAPQH